MKLIAIWVEDYMKFKDQTFNLDSPVEFIFDFNRDTRELSISTKKKDNYVQMFNDPLVSVTAIVGKNGAGKTSFLKLLNVINSTKPLEKPVILVFQNLENAKQPSYKIIVYQHNDFLFDDLKGKRRKIQVALLGELNELKDNNELELIAQDYNPDPFLKIDVLNYDYLFSDENDKYLKLRDPLNRKMMYQVSSKLDKQSLKDYISEHDKKEIEPSLFINESFNPFKLYFKKKLESRISFLAKVHTDPDFPRHLIEKINLPKTISLSFNYSIFQLLEEKFKEDKFKGDTFYPLLKKKNQQWLQKINTTKNNTEAFKNRVLLQIINIGLYHELCLKNNNYVILDALKHFVEKEESNKTISFKDLHRFVEETLKTSNVLSINQYDKLFDVINDVVNELLISQDSLSLSSLSTLYEVNIDDKTWSLIDPLLSLNYLDDAPFFEYYFDNLSSGEDALLTQYTEIHNGITATSREFLMILIDEGEINLHPEWQREYLNSTIEFINYKARDGVKVQLILSSHSPFILSDLTKNQVVFLNHNNDAYRLGVSTKQNNKRETFGANIYDLFKDSFFMNNGFIGEFAKNKIDNVFKDLSTAIEKKITIEQARKEEIKSIISVIGEPLIKRQLSKMYDKLYETDLEIEAIDEQIKKLEEFKNRKQKKGNDKN